MFGEDPSGSWFDELNPVMKLWMFENWQRDLVEKNEFAKQYAILTGFFYNQELARNMWGVGKVEHKTEDDDFEKLTQNIKELNKQEVLKNKRRNRVAVG